jgi:hypothetical protein
VSTRCTGHTLASLTPQGLRGEIELHGSQRIGELLELSLSHHGLKARVDSVLDGTGPEDLPGLLEELFVCSTGARDRRGVP